MRLEFILRRTFLRKIGVNSPQDLAKLRDLNLRALLRIRRLNPAGVGGLCRNPLGTASTGVPLMVGEMALSGFAARAKGIQCGLSLLTSSFYLRSIGASRKCKNG